MNKLSTETYTAIVEEIESAVVELAKSVNEYRLRLAWEVGKVVRSSELPVTELVKKLSKEPRMKHIHMGERNLFKAVGVFDLAPENFEDLYKTELGQSVTVNKLLGVKTEKVECAHPTVELLHRCTVCKDIIAYETNATS